MNNILFANACGNAGKAIPIFPQALRESWCFLKLAFKPNPT